MITRIIYPVPNDTLGNLTDAECTAYRLWLYYQLSDAYTAAEVDVTSADCGLYIRADDDDDEQSMRDQVREFGNRCWDNCPWSGYPFARSDTAAQRGAEMRPQSYRQRLHQFARSYVVMDLRDPIETRLARATAYERRYKTAGKPSRYKIGPDLFEWIAEVRAISRTFALPRIDIRYSDSKVSRRGELLENTYYIWSAP